MAGPGLLRLQGEKQIEPLGKLIVAQTAGTLFDIGLEMEDGVAVFQVARAGHLGEILDDACSTHAARVRAGGCVLKPLVESVIPAEIAAVQQRHHEFKVVGIEAIAFLVGSNRRAGAQSDIPHGLGTACG